MNDGVELQARENQKFVPICAIGASAGGVVALQGLFRQLSTELGLAYVVILHLAPDQPSAMCEILAACTRMPVLQIDEAPILRPNCVYVIPPDRELVIDGDSIAARPFSEPRGHRAPIDIFFRSIAAGRGDGIAIVLSGAGTDGSQGVRAIKEAGGVIMVQEPAEAGFASMPQNAIATGVADFIAPLARMAERLAEVALSKEAVRSLDMDGNGNELRRIVAFLRARTGHDFSSYKRATVMRRVVRRMQVCRTDTLQAYASYLLATPEEAKELFSDLLISVTMFFRDPGAFEALDRRVIKQVFDELDSAVDNGIRAWVVGCATGEEAYSLAILLHEEAGRRKLMPQIQIFATDLDEGALATAREGRYPRTIEAVISEERLARFFVDEGAHYRVRREMRESVLFASHSVIKEPPFMRLDLITCRNLMIYLERSLQQQLCALFHYGLKPGRFLFLGSAETADVAADMFVPVDREARIYRARAHATFALPVMPQFAVRERSGSSDHLLPSQAGRADTKAGLHVAALERIAPPSVLVDEGQNILHLSPNAGRFIMHSAGPISTVLPVVVRPELRLDLRLALIRALEAKEPSLTHPAIVTMEGGRRQVAMHVTPVPDAAHASAQALVMFLDGGIVPGNEEPAYSPDTRSDEVRRLHAELKVAQIALIASRSGHETAIHDLQASNEEQQSINEEYRSTAEELETSKEELQSINEELHTVNAEMKSKLASISVAHSDLQNLTATSEIGTLFLDPDLRVRMFTSPIAELFNVTPADIGRTVTDFTHHLEYDRLAEDVGSVLRDLIPVETEVRSKDGRWHVMRLRPYRTVDDRIDGTVVTLVDITARRRAEAARLGSETRFRAFVSASSDVVYRMSPDWSQMHQLDGNGVMADLDEPTESWMDQYIPAEERPAVQHAVDQAIKDQSMFELEHRARRVDGTAGWILSRALPILGPDGEIVEWLGAAKDVTTARESEEALRDSEQRLRTLMQGIPQLVWRSAADGLWSWSSPQWQSYTGQSQDQSHGWGWLEAIHPDDRDMTRQAWLEAQPHGRLNQEHRVRRAADGAWRWHQTRSVPLRAELRPDGTEGAILEWLGTTTDIEDLKRLQAQQEVMVAELQHRTRNLLAVVRSVARRSIPSSVARDEYDARLAALGRVQGFLSRSPLFTVRLRDVVQAELEATGDATLDKVSVGGPAVDLPGESIQAIALAIHELATNAVKHGALTQAAARLSVTWTVEPWTVEPGTVEPGTVEPGTVEPGTVDPGASRLVLDWCESGVAMPDGPPVRRGYGTELITKALPYQLQAETLLEFKDDGVWCRIVLPSGAFREVEGTP